jgi:predicted GTPase
MRVMAKIPILIMGETGCGKTSLITFLAKEIL